MKTVCIILNYNDAETTASLVSSIRDHQSLDHILVVDNASTDDSAARLKTLEDGRVSLIISTENGGYGAGNNFGLRYAAEKLGADYALISNPDVFFSDETAAELTRVMKAHPELGVLAPVQKSTGVSEEGQIPGSRENTMTGAAGWPLRGWFYDLLESGPVSRRIFRPILHYPMRKFEDRKAVYVDCVPGSLLLVDIEKMLSFGGYDENVFLYEEEYILGQLMRGFGYKTGLLLSESYEHRHGVTIGKNVGALLKRQKLRNESTLYYFREYLGVGKAELLFTKLFQAVVDLEIRIAGGGR